VLASLLASLLAEPFYCRQSGAAVRRFLRPHFELPMHCHLRPSNCPPSWPIPFLSADFLFSLSFLFLFSSIEQPLTVCGRPQLVNSSTSLPGLSLMSTTSLRPKRGRPRG